MHNSSKICLISFDNWNYDKEIIVALKSRNIDCAHINLGKFAHKNLLEQFTNLLSKIFLNKNPKLKKRQEFILEYLEKTGPYNQILVINPELIDEEYHHKIKNFTNRYVAYLYDSIERFSIEHLTQGVFDKIFSFDAGDCEKYGFQKTNNYIYLPEQKISDNSTYNALTITSFDKRFPNYNSIANYLSLKNINFKFVFVSRNIVYKQLKYNFKALIFKNKTVSNSKNIFKEKKIPLEKLLQEYQNTKCIVDLVHKNQLGLSFRVFEAMALKKKIITDNVAIKKYDFFDNSNIYVVENNIIDIPKSFFETTYKDVQPEIYKQYTIDSWVARIFNLDQIS